MQKIIKDKLIQNCWGGSFSLFWENAWIYKYDKWGSPENKLSCQIKKSNIPCLVKTAD